MQRHGLKSAGKRARLESAAEDEAEALLKMQVRIAAQNKDRWQTPLPECQVVCICTCPYRFDMISFPGML